MTAITRAADIADRPPLRFFDAVTSLLRCVAATGNLLLTRRTHLLPVDVGRRLRFEDGTSAPIYRETVVDHGNVGEPCLLVVSFRLRFVRGRVHTLFRWESILNTPLFVGFPGLIAKWWLAADETGRYRGIYDWDGADLADRYARSLWWVLALVCPVSSIHYVIVRGASREDLRAGRVVGDEHDTAGWWRIVAA